MSLTLVGEKLGMTRLFEDNGISRAVTVVSLFDLTVCGFRTVEKNGYTAILVGYGEVEEKKLKKPQIGFFKKSNLPLFKNIYEIRVNDIQAYELGQKISFDFLNSVMCVDVIGTSIGKGFAGVMKRHNFKGLRASHGVSISHRAHGSIGSCQDPGKVFKNKKMAGHMGNEQVTVKNLKVLRFDEERGLLFIVGSVPGAKKSKIKIKY